MQFSSVNDKKKSTSSTTTDLVAEEKESDRGRPRTCNPQIQSLVPYPLGHTVVDEKILEQAIPTQKFVEQKVKINKIGLL